MFIKLINKKCPTPTDTKFRFALKHNAQKEKRHKGRYSIDKLQDRGKFFIDPGEEVYAGQVVGEHVHENDLVINVTKTKQLTNVRASGSDEKARVIPKTVMSLEECLEYINGDEYVEVTPKSMRMRKTILDHDQRKKAMKES